MSRRGPKKGDLTVAEDKLDRLGLLTGGGTFADALLEASDLMIPNLPKRGREKSNMTQAMFRTFIRNILNGLPKAQAAAAAGFTGKTASRWISAGRKDVNEGRNTAQSVFYLTTSQAEGVLMSVCTQSLLQALTQDWRAGDAFMRNRFGWGQQKDVETEAEEEEDAEEARRNRLRKALPEYAERPAVIDALDDLDEVE